jgi:hypothetical protein
MSIPFVGKRFTPAAFTAEVQRVAATSPAWWGQYPVLHHTAAPSLAQRPNGLTDQHLQNLLDYYQNQLGWSGAPHLFVDDREDGIIVFQRLDRRGVHAKSFNASGWGIEMLGDYDSEDSATGRGAKVLENACHATEALLGICNLPVSGFKLHREDPQTSKTCPGNKVKRSMIEIQIRAIRAWHQASQSPRPTVEPVDQFPSSWAADAWGKAEAVNLMQGNPQGTLTREMLAVVLDRLEILK